MLSASIEKRQPFIKLRFSIYNPGYFNLHSCPHIWGPGLKTQLIMLSVM